MGKTRANKRKTTELAARVAYLEARLVDEHEQRQLLIETNNLLARLLAGRDVTGPIPLSTAVEEDALDASEGIRARRRARRLVLCNMSRQRAQKIVFAVVEEIDPSNVSVDDDTKLGVGGLGWNDVRKRACFIPIHDLVADKGCDFRSSADEFEGFLTVGEMVDHVMARSVRLRSSG